MSRHNLQAELAQADMTQPVKIGWLPEIGKHAVKIGTGAPTGTPDALFYARTDATTPQTSLYDGSTGAWVAKDDFGAAGINADIIAESTSAAGVTVDGALIKDGSVTIVDGGALKAGGQTTGIKIGATAGDKIGFFNATPAVKPTALTTAVVAAASMTFTEPGTPDYAIQGVTQTTPFGFVNANEGNSLIKVVQNLVKRVEELESKLQGIGLLT